MESTILTEQELRIFSHQIQLGPVGLSGQEKLKNTSVLVIGAGGLGMTVLQDLSSIGIGILGISDNSLIQETDLPRYTLFGIGDLGKQKAITAKEKLGKLHPQITYNIHNICISDNNTNQICDNYNIMVDATKHLLTSRLLNSTCCSQQKPMVYGFLHGLTGMVTVFNYQGGHRFEDIFPEDKSSDNHYGPLSTIAPVVGITGSYMAGEVIKIALGLKITSNQSVIHISL